MEENFRNQIFSETQKGPLTNSFELRDNEFSRENREKPTSLKLFPGTKEVSPTKCFDTLTQSF